MFFKGNHWFAVATTVFCVGLLAGCGAHDTGKSGPGEQIGQQASAVEPAPPTPVSPNGTETSPTPTYVWNSVAEATTYALWVDDSAGNKIANLIVDPAAAGCSGGGQCSHTPATALAPGAAVWWVRSIAGAEPGPWSTATNFTVGSGPAPTEAPGIVTTISPTGTVGTATPTYTWNSITGAGAAANYLLWVDSGGTSGVIIQSYTAAAAGCASGGVCSVTPATALSQGLARFWVQASNSVGTGPWSMDRPFTVTTGASSPPLAPTLTNPTGTVTTATPTYEWDASATATSYFLWVDDSTSGGSGKIQLTLTAAEANCDADSVCTSTPATALANGAAIFWVQASNAAGSSAWSSRSFTVDATVATPPAVPTLIGPMGTVTTATPTYEWNASPGATDYFLWVDGPGAPGQIQVHFTPAQANCDADAVCSVTPATALAEGGAYFWIKASNSAGDNGWSSSLFFVVDTP